MTRGRRRSNPREAGGFKPASLFSIKMQRRASLLIK
jgi:hypothetical protein